MASSWLAGRRQASGCLQLALDLIPDHRADDRGVLPVMDLILVADPLRRHLTFELGKAQEHVQRQPPMPVAVLKGWVTDTKEVCAASSRSGHWQNQPASGSAPSGRTRPSPSSSQRRAASAASASSRIRRARANVRYRRIFPSRIGCAPAGCNSPPGDCSSRSSGHLHPRLSGFSSTACSRCVKTLAGGAQHRRAPRVGGDRFCVSDPASVYAFQSAPPGGGRHPRGLHVMGLFGFNPRPRVGGDARMNILRRAVMQFQSAPPGGGRPPLPGREIKTGPVSIRAPGWGAT